MEIENMAGRAISLSSCINFIPVVLSAHGSLSPATVVAGVLPVPVLPLANRVKK